MKSIPGRRAVSVVLAVGLCPLVTAVSCPPAKVCNLAFDGPHVVAGQVVDAIHAVCDVAPQTHLLRASIQFAVGDEWIELGRVAVVDQIPRPGAPVDVDITSPCREGTYRSKAHVAGVGPSGTAYEFDDVTAEVDVALIQCAS